MLAHSLRQQWNINDCSLRYVKWCSSSPAALAIALYHSFRWQIDWQAKYPIAPQPLMHAYRFGRSDQLTLSSLTSATSHTLSVVATPDRTSCYNAHRPLNASSYPSIHKLKSATWLLSIHRLGSLHATDAIHCVLLLCTHTMCQSCDKKLTSTIRPIAKQRCVAVLMKYAWEHELGSPS